VAVGDKVWPRITASIVTLSEAKGLGSSPAAQNDKVWLRMTFERRLLRLRLTMTRSERLRMTKYGSE
jgi:hypothetical protein